MIGVCRNRLSNSNPSAPGNFTSSVIRENAVRAQSDNADLKRKVAELMAGRTEFVQVDAGDGVTIDGWLIKPLDPIRLRRAIRALLSGGTYMDESYRPPDVTVAAPS